MTAELGAVRDLIEAGLNEPADAGRRAMGFVLRRRSRMIDPGGWSSLAPASAMTNGWPRRLQPTRPSAFWMRRCGQEPGWWMVRHGGGHGA